MTTMIFGTASRRRWGIAPFAVLALCAAAQAGAAAAEAPEGTAAEQREKTDGEPVPVHLAGIQVVDQDQALLILADEEEQRAIPIAVGRDQGLAIYLGESKTPMPRPMTHDLIVQILHTLRVKVEKIVITDLRESTYYAEIALKRGRERHTIDARPSDAIALAVRLETPIFASPDLLTTLGGGEEETPDLDADAGRSLGLGAQELEDDLAKYLGASGVHGVLVASVQAGSPAGRAGLRRGDILLRLDGRPTGDLDAYRRAAAAARSAPRFEVWREGKELSLVTP